MMVSDKKREKMEQFNRLINEGMAPVSMKVPAQEKKRKKVCEKFEEKILLYTRGVQVAKELILGEMLYVRALARTYRGENNRIREVDFIVTPETINQDSVRCILWSQEYHSWETKRMVKGRGESKVAIKFQDILSWRTWIPKDAAFTVNHIYQTPAYKKLAYGV
jgi:hypothetical protein